MRPEVIRIAGLALHHAVAVRILELLRIWGREAVW